MTGCGFTGEVWFYFAARCNDYFDLLFITRCRPKGFLLLLVYSLLEIIKCLPLSA